MKETSESGTLATVSALQGHNSISAMKLVIGSGIKQLQDAAGLALYISTPFYVCYAMSLLSFSIRQDMLTFREVPSLLFVLRSSFQLETTEDGTCDQRWKTTPYLQCAGFPLPMVFESEPESSTPELNPFESITRTGTHPYPGEYIGPCDPESVCRLAL